MKSARTDTRRLVTLAIFTALIVVLQLVANVAKIGPVSITLSLVPIVVGAALYGVGAGGYLGGVFGLVVLICCITGLDVGGSILWNSNPLMTAVVCLLKGALAGVCAGLMYRAVAKKNKTAGAVCAGIAAPLTNTALFVAAMALFFRQELLAWTAGWAAEAGREPNPLYYIILGLAGLNFLVELCINLVLAPIIVRIISARRPFAVPVRIVSDDTKSAD